MEDNDHVLRAPRNGDEWRAYHAIRRQVLFENRGEVGVYIENHPDEFAPGHHPLVLIYSGAPIGVIRVDVSGRVAWFRRVAVCETLQRCGHGRTLLRLAEALARREGCQEVRSNVAADAVGFYERCGYSRDLSTPAAIGSVPMLKTLL
jgi:GNAT superfamily N-acetyltransferase